MTSACPSLANWSPLGPKARVAMVRPWRDTKAEDLARELNIAAVVSLFNCIVLDTLGRGGVTWILFLACVCKKLQLECSQNGSLRIFMGKWVWLIPPTRVLIHLPVHSGRISTSNQIKEHQLPADMRRRRLLWILPLLPTRTSFCEYSMREEVTVAAQLPESTETSSWIMERSSWTMLGYLAPKCKMPLGSRDVHVQCCWWEAFQRTIDVMVVSHCWFGTTLYRKRVERRLCSLGVEFQPASGDEDCHSEFLFDGQEEKTNDMNKLTILLYQSEIDQKTVWFVLCLSWHSSVGERMHATINLPNSKRYLHVMLQNLIGFAGPSSNAIDEIYSARRS